MLRAMVLADSAVPLSLKASMGGAVAGRAGDDVASPSISQAALAAASAEPALPAVGDQVCASKRAPATPFSSAGAQLPAVCGTHCVSCHLSITLSLSLSRFLLAHLYERTWSLTRA